MSSSLLFTSAVKLNTSGHKSCFNKIAAGMLNKFIAPIFSDGLISKCSVQVLMLKPSRYVNKKTQNSTEFYPYTHAFANCTVHSGYALQLNHAVFAFNMKKGVLH
jgi:hypothetical protein